MKRAWIPGRSARKAGGLLLAAGMLACMLSGIAGCLGDPDQGGKVLQFRNPGLIDEFDSLRVDGINAAGGDTVAIYAWKTGEAIRREVAYPPGLKEDFELLVKGFKTGILVYQSRSTVAAGKAGSPKHDFRLTAPDLPELPVRLSARVRDALVLKPVWKTRPGVYRQGDGDSVQSFAPQAEYGWEKDGRSLGRDTSLDFASLKLEDGGSYRFQAENPAGRDSLWFYLEVRHMLPRIAALKDQIAAVGKPFSLHAVVTASDSLLYRWLKADTLVSTDSVLAFNPMKAADTGSYRLIVRNASDTAENMASNRFSLRPFVAPEAIWKPEKSLEAGAQANSSHGTALDLDVAKAMLYQEANQKQALIDMLLVFSGGSLKLMNALAAKKAGDISYMTSFDEGKLVDVKFVKVTAKPANLAAAKAAFDAGTKVNAIAATAGTALIVKTTDGNWAYVKIEAIQDPPSPSVSVVLTLALGDP